MGHLTLHLSKIAELTGGDSANAITWFYTGLAIAIADPDKARELMQQLEREVAAHDGDSPELIEVDMRGAVERIRPFIESALV